MMDQTIMMTLIVISILYTANGQLRCYVCTDCPNIDDDTVSQPCEFVPPPDTTTTTTVTPTDTTTTTTLSTTTLPPTDTTTTTTLSTTTMPPETSISTPNTPPTATTTTVIPPTIIDSFRPNDIPVNESIIEVTTDKSTDLSDENNDETADRRHGNTQISLGPPYRRLIHKTSGSYQCFRIGRTVGDRIEVVRGCVVPADTIHQTCVRANNGITPTTCRICQHTDCNNTTRNTSTSIVLLFTSIVSIQFLR